MVCGNHAGLRGSDCSSTGSSRTTVRSFARAVGVAAGVGGVSSVGAQRIALGYLAAMPYDITGWVETTWATAEDRAEYPEGLPWSATVCLDGLGMNGDAVSDLLFGLTKDPSGNGRFVDRGLPPEASLPVLAAYELERRERFGAFGYTYATLREVQSVCWHEYGVVLAESIWSHVVCLMDDLSEMDQFDADRVRIVVWAYW